MLFLDGVGASALRGVLGHNALGWADNLDDLTGFVTLHKRDKNIIASDSVFFMNTFMNAGWFAFIIAFFAMIALLVSLVALIGGIARGRSRAWPLLGSASLFLAGLGFASGGVGTWMARRRVVEILGDGESINYEVMELIFVEGFREARDVSIVAIVLVSLPFFLALASALIGTVRAKSDSGKPFLLERGMVGVFALFALLGLVSTLVGLMPSDESAKASAVAVLQRQLPLKLANRGVACISLKGALDWRGPEQLEKDVPGTRDHAVRCVEQRLKNIEASNLQKDWDETVLPPRRPSPLEEKPPVVEGEDNERKKMLREAAAVGILGLIGQGNAFGSKKEALEDLLQSPLLVDEGQRKRAEELLKQEQ